MNDFIAKYKAEHPNDPAVLTNANAAWEASTECK